MSEATPNRGDLVILTKSEVETVKECFNKAIEMYIDSDLNYAEAETDGDSDKMEEWEANTKEAAEDLKRKFEKALSCAK